MKRLILCLMILGTSSAVYSQIEISSDEINSSFFFPSAPQAHWSSEDTNGLPALDVLNGSGKTWDFTTRSYTLDPNGGPPPLVPFNTSMPLANDPDFSSATDVLIDSITPQFKKYEFYRIDPTGFWELGQSEDSMGVPSKVRRYSQPFLQVKFPLTYLSTWQGSCTAYDLKYGDTIAYSIEGAVDGYGALKLPSAPDQSALRVSLKFTDRYNTEPSNTSVSFFWWTKSLYWAAVYTDDTQKPRSVTYAEPIGSSEVKQSESFNDPMSIRLSINAQANSEIKLLYTLARSGPVKLVTLDVLGRRILTLKDGFANVGENATSIDESMLRPGTYFVRLISGSSSAMQKLTISH